MSLEELLKYFTGEAEACPCVVCNMFLDLLLGVWKDTCRRNGAMDGYAHHAETCWHHRYQPHQ